MEQVKLQVGKMKDLWATLKRGQFQTADYRMRTRINAYLQIAMFVLLLILVIVGVFASTMITIWLWDYENSEETKLRKSIKRGAISVVWLYVVGLGIEAGLQLWAAIRLLKSTKINIEPSHALKLSSFWRNVTLVFIFVDIVIVILYFKLYFWGTLFVMLRVGFLGEVYGFRNCLEKDIIANNRAENKTAAPVIVVN